MWLVPELPFFTTRICVVIFSTMVSVCEITHTFLPLAICIIDSALMTSESVDGSSEPKPSSIKRCENEVFCVESDDKPNASPRLTINVSPPESDVVSRRSLKRSWSITRMPSELRTCSSS